MSKPAKHPKPGTDPHRQRNAAATREAILAAAQTVFSRTSFGNAGIREIAKLAQVNSALIARYFGSKLELFEAALDAALDVDVFTSSPRNQFGAMLAESFCNSGPTDAPAITMLAFSAGESSTRDCALRLLRQRVIIPLEHWFGEPESAERAVQLMTVVTGFFVYRVMLPLDAARDTTSPAMRRWLAASLQEIVDR